MPEMSQPETQPVKEGHEEQEESNAKAEATKPPPLPALLPPLFELGRVYATPGALEALRDAATEPTSLLNRHQRGDWGDLCAEDREANRKALVLGYRLLSAYQLPETSEKIWIITEADRCATTLLLPEEY